MEVSYKNSIEQYIDLALMKVYYSRKHVLKSIGISLIPFLVFCYLCYSRYSYDVKYSGHLTESTSSVLLIYLICGTLWVALLPILYWRIKSSVITKEIENMKIKCEGEVKYILDQDKLSIISKYNKMICNWNSVKSVEQRNKFIIINIRGFEQSLIPTSAFKDADENKVFIEYIRNQIHSNGLTDEKEGKQWN